MEVAGIKKVDNESIGKPRIFENSIFLWSAWAQINNWKSREGSEMGKYRGRLC